MTVECRFTQRWATGDGHFTYEPIEVPSKNNRSLLFPEAPKVGDWIDFLGFKGTVYRVVDRVWRYPAYGSAIWPYGADQPTDGLRITLFVEVALGPYRDEAR